MAKQRLSEKKERKVAQALGVPVGSVWNRGGSPGWQVYDPQDNFLGYFSPRTWQMIPAPPRILTLAEMYRANNVPVPPGLE